MTSDQIGKELRRAILEDPDYATELFKEMNLSDSETDAYSEAELVALQSVELAGSTPEELFDILPGIIMDAVFAGWYAAMMSGEEA